MHTRPGHALYFASYEAAKDLLGGNEEGHQPIASATAGAIATVINDAFMTPLDVIKQRLQVIVMGDTSSISATVCAVPSMLLSQPVK